MAARDGVETGEPNGVWDAAIYKPPDGPAVRGQALLFAIDGEDNQQLARGKWLAN